MQQNYPSSSKVVTCSLYARNNTFPVLFPLLCPTSILGVIVVMLEYKQHELQCGSMKPHALELPPLQM